MYGWLQLVIFLSLLLLLTKPVGLYLMRVLARDGKTALDFIIKPMEKTFYRVLRIDPDKEQSWRSYSLSVLAFSLIGFVFCYAILRLQHVLPLNPQRLGPVSPVLAFNTTVSFLTNTNWQNYGGETTLSYFSQMVGLVFHNFASAAVGLAVAAALVRGIARHAAHAIGNFWVDLVRIHLYLLLPICLILSVFFVSQGMIQNFQPYVAARGLESTPQVIPQGPLASQAAIKLLGTNGGGFFNANAAHPYENPTPLANFIQMLAIFLIPSGLTYYLGRMVNHQRHGWAVWCAMSLLFLAALLLCWHAEAVGNPRLSALGIDPAGNSMEGKEVRFGIFNSSLFATVTTAASCGAVNAMHDSFTPMGGLVLLVNIQLGEVVFGGVGAGLFGMLVFTLLAVFLTGLMVGRTPEYLGKKIEPYDVKLCVLIVAILIFCILGFTAWATKSAWGKAGMSNAGPHGLSEALYAYSSASGNNGSAFAGLNGNSSGYPITLGLAMLLGRFFMIVPVLALAGNLARKKKMPLSEGRFPVSGLTFVAVLVGTVLIVGALTFFPVLALGPVVEHFFMTATNSLF